MPTNGESEWDAEERSLMIALGRVERNTGQYGEWLPDATSPRADPNDSTIENPIRYIAHEHTNYAAKAALEADEKARKKAGESGNFNGVFWSVELREYGTPGSGS